MRVCVSVCVCVRACVLANLAGPADPGLQAFVSRCCRLLPGARPEEVMTDSGTELLASNSHRGICGLFYGSFDFLPRTDRRPTVRHRDCMTTTRLLLLGRVWRRVTPEPLVGQFESLKFETKKRLQYKPKTKKPLKCLYDKSLSLSLTHTHTHS